MKELFYINGMMGGTKESNKEFWKELERIKEHSIKATSRWDMDYLVETYTLDDNSIVEYWCNMEYGIPHSIKYIKD